jgi:hypothetical protein
VICKRGRGKRPRSAYPFPSNGAGVTGTSRRVQTPPGAVAAAIDHGPAAHVFPLRAKRRGRRAAEVEKQKDILIKGLLTSVRSKRFCFFFQKEALSLTSYQFNPPSIDAQGNFSGF